MNTAHKPMPDDRRPTTVFLVGAGPGDPGLITVRGLQCIQKADVIVYDRLANPELLKHARAECELIYAGKESNQHAMKQEEINELLAVKALEGKIVCRLKGGDPFLFGRGGEECLHLLGRGVAFEVVPGVTAALGATAYAGIPITHRGESSAVHIATGHEDSDKKESAIPWDALAKTRDTVVFYMGVKNIGNISRRLIEGGRPPETPTALVANGTLPSQRTLLATLETIEAQAEKANVRPPALLLIGEVTALSKRLGWFEKRPLFGKRIIVTRARAQASELTSRLRELGAEAIEVPAIRIENLADASEMRSMVDRVKDFDWICFTSANAVDAFWEALTSKGLDARELSGVELAVIGAKTAARLANRGLRADLIPERHTSESLAEALRATGMVEGRKFLLPQSEIAQPALAEAIRNHGGEVVAISAYRTLIGEDPDEALLARLEAGEIDWTTFTSSSTVKNFIETIPEERRASILPKMRAVSIGPKTSKTARDLGIEVVVEAETSTIEGLIKALMETIDSMKNTD